MERFKERCSDLALFPDVLAHEDTLTTLFSVSDFVAEKLIAKPEWAIECLTQKPEIYTYQHELASILSNTDNEATLHKELRLFRHKKMVQIAIHDLLNLQDIAESLRQVSSLADVLIMSAYQWLYDSLCLRYATPQGTYGPQPLLIIGMGKLGGSELNFSSDIDLIFAYPEQGEIPYGRKSIEHHQFFIKLAQKLIAALHQTTVDGQVFRVDMRLRPFGDSGPLVTSFAALEDYYQEQGREWERYAMVKGRVLNHRDKYSEQLHNILRPFVFRRYIDFSVLESLRKMKQLIRQEVRRRNLKHNIKLGSGGIREVEFIVQCFQLTRGGREPALQEKSLLNMLTVLSQTNILATKNCQQLRDDYLYLRKIEHCLQQINDEQTQELPNTEESQLRLCAVLSKSNFTVLHNDITKVMHRISLQFEQLIGEEQEDAFEDLDAYKDLWLLDMTSEESAFLLEQTLENDDNQLIVDCILGFKDDISNKPMGARGKESLDRLAPMLVKACLEFDFSNESNDEVLNIKRVKLLNRVFAIVKSVLRRTAYLELLLENNGALNQLIKLCQQSSWVAEQLTRFPLLLDELLNPSALYNPTPLPQYPDLLRQILLRVPEDDLEQQMESLRQFKLSHQLRVAAADLYGSLPVMKVSDHLTCLAETLINEAVNSAWQQMTEKYGYPAEATDDDKLFLVVGYGKLGGIELGYSSDLDLVFLHRCNSSADTSGPKTIDSRQFYVKFAQRILHLFNTKTSSGELYEIDMRLRPSGNSGLLVSHIDAFEQYQLEEAWIWEHQALVRARGVAGSDSMRKAFIKVRENVLCRERETSELKKAVAEMRQKMRLHLDKSNHFQLDLKQGRGAITDIEFLTQFWALLYAAKSPKVIYWSDNVRILEALEEAALITPEQSRFLINTYLTIRNASHQKALSDKQNVSNINLFDAERQVVAQIWDDTFASL